MLMMSATRAASPAAARQYAAAILLNTLPRGLLIARPLARGKPSVNTIACPGSSGDSEG